MDYRILIFALLVVLILVFVWKRREHAKGGRKPTKKKGKKPIKQRAKKSEAMDNDGGDDLEDVNDNNNDDDSSERPAKKSGDVAEDAKELYGLVHSQLAAGMQIDAFEQAAGDLAGDEPSEVFVALKQKYTEAIDSNRDPMRSISVKDYIEILKKSG